MTIIPITFMGFNSLKTDNISGASEILCRTADYWHDEIQSLLPSSLRRGLTTIRHRGLFIIQLFPRMAPLFHLVNRVLLSINQAASVDELKAHAQLSIEHTIVEMTKAKSALIPFARKLIRPGMSVFIYSRSSLVLSILKELHQTGIKLKVLITEARPMNEGLRVAGQLLHDGFEVNLFVDAAMQEAVETCDVVFIGADTFTDSRVVNKIGTTALALLAREADKPVYCFTTSNKYLPPGFKQPPEKDHSRREVWRGAPKGIQIRNKYFESTPIALISHVITESGYFKADDPSPVKKFPIDEWLREQLSR